jgi:hypothetical protein
MIKLSLCICWWLVFLYKRWLVSWYVLYDAVTWDHVGRSSSPGPRNFSHLQGRPDKLWVPLSLLLKRCRCPFLGLRQPGRDINHLLTYTVEVANEWTYTSTSPLRFPGSYWTILPLPLSYMYIMNKLTYTRVYIDKERLRNVCVWTQIHTHVYALRRRDTLDLIICMTAAVSNSVKGITNATKKVNHR